MGTSRDEANSALTARLVLGIASLVLVTSVGVAALLPSDTSGRVGGTAGVAAAVTAGIALVAAWIASLWHAASLRPWTATAPRWLVLAVLAFGTGVAGLFYYLFFAHWQRPRSVPPGQV